jgi:hypothetical protein
MAEADDKPLIRPLRLDPDAASASAHLPAFLARPDDAPVYHGFPIIRESLTDGWQFGTISDYEDPAGCDFGDAFVIAPDGSRAGLVWSVGDYPTREVCRPDAGRWGVYEIAFCKPVRTTADFVECCRAVLPELSRIFLAIEAAA